jgi:DUF971 family protein
VNDCNSNSDAITPVNLHLKKSEALLITWADGHQSHLPLRMLRKFCPCAGCQGERDILGRTRMPVVTTTYDGPITATGAELVGNYGLRIEWADGHSAGIYTFLYLRELDAQNQAGISHPADEGAGIPPKPDAGTSTDITA